MALSTPKFRSQDWKDAESALKGIFDARSLAVVLVDALERRAAEQIYAKLEKAAQKARLKNLKKDDLVAAITESFFSSDDTAYKVVKEMDRVAKKERHIIESIPDEQAPDRVGAYRAIALKRERAKFVWALARDSRPSVRELANRVINEFFKAAADLQAAKAITEGRGGVGDDVELAKRLQEQAERLSEAAHELSDLRSTLTKQEEERARLLVAVGAKERVLRQQTEAREELEDQLKDLRSRLDDLDTREMEAEEARKSGQEARIAQEELQTKVRRLEKLAGAAENLGALQSELEKTKRLVDDSDRARRRDAQAYQREREELDKERGRLRADLDEAREELKKARKRISDLESGAGKDTSDAERDGRVAILLDQANIAGVAFQVYKRKVNFSALLENLRSGRKVSRAIAFVVDNGGTAFDAFCDTLRKTGWELRIKKPKKFADGRSKADWDMGIAMTAIDLRDKVDGVVLASGDGDFAPLVRRLQRWGLRVEVATFPDGLASELSDVVDHVEKLDEHSLE